MTKTISSLAARTRRKLGSLYGGLRGLGRLDDLSRRLDRTDVLLREIHEQVVRAKREVKVSRAHAELHFWAGYRRDGEDLRAARYRFFAGLPPAEGADRQVQVESARLLRTFADVCDGAGIGWWLKGGTLLGAHRHRGFVPWDDDVDVAIIGTDLARLQAAVAEQPHHRLTIRYDPLGLCKQIRFAARDAPDGMFVDVFPYAVSTRTVAECADLYAARRAALERALSTWAETPRWLEQGAVGVDDELGAAVERIVDEAVARFGVALNDTGGAARGESWSADGDDGGITIVCGIESVSPDRVEDHPRPVPLASVFPLGTETFEGEVYPAPRDAPAWLASEYGDYLRLPFDILDHVRHHGT